jgi:hypothetical protein
MDEEKNIQLSHAIDFIQKHQTISSDHPYFQKINSCSLESFFLTQRYFVICVSHWSTILICLLQKVPPQPSFIQERLVLIENLFDEHGKGDIQAAHVYTFSRFCARLSDKVSFFEEKKGQKNTVLSNKVSSFEEKKGQKSQQACQDFNEQVLNFIQEKDWKEGFACLGAIEYLYAQISSKLHKCVQTRFQIPAQEIPHYCCHEELDVKHGEDLLLAATRSSDFCKSKVEQACLAGIQFIENLYTKMSEDLS